LSSGTLLNLITCLFPSLPSNCAEEHGYFYEISGRSYLRTTMIYTHCVPSRTVKEAKSPLDF